MSPLPGHSVYQDAPYPWFSLYKHFMCIGETLAKASRGLRGEEMGSRFTEARLLQINTLARFAGGTLLHINTTTRFAEIVCT